MIRKAVLSAGIVAGLLGSVALAPSAYAQALPGFPYWNGAAPGPVSDYGNGYGASAPDANWGGWAAAPGGDNVPGVSTPYWLGAPRSIGPGY
jgi:hypothetical protein